MLHCTGSTPTMQSILEVEVLAGAVATLEAPVQQDNAARKRPAAYRRSRSTIKPRIGVRTY